MSNAHVAEPPAAVSPEVLQRLVDQALSFHVFALPEETGRGAAIHTSGFGVTGVRVSGPLHRFRMELEHPSQAGVRGLNTLGEVAGRLDLRWLFIPHELMAAPDREPPPTALDPSRSQRFVIQDGTFSFGDGSDGFRCFGAGRTFPANAGGRPRLMVAAVGDLIETSGRLQGHAGNFTLCGDLSPDRGFLGEIMIRLLDFDGSLRVSEPLPPIAQGPFPDPEATFLTWIAQKGHRTEQENWFSLTPDGQVRGVNIPVDLHRVAVDFVPRGPQGFAGSPLGVEPGVIGLEIGFGRETRPRFPGAGTPLTPFQFEGVSEYLFDDRDGRTVGTLTANVLEGRSFAVDLPGAPGQPALRFGYFGAMVGGKGCFEGAQGILYGTAGSVFALPPGPHVISNLYVARLIDPDGRFRSTLGRTG
jgi:hypothetical protein